jgi:L-rhamnose mutarotase
MEIPEMILTQALVKSNSSSIHVELDNFLKKLESKTLEKILSAEEDEEIWSIDNKIRDIVTQTIHFNQKSEDDKIENVGQIIFSAKEYLRKGVSNGDVKSILIFLSVNCYLHIKLEKLLSTRELESGYTKVVSEKIIQVLKSIKLSTQALPNAPYWEKEIMSESLKGFSENDISKTYRFIESVERSGRGFHFNFLLESLLSFLFHLNYTYFLNSLSYLQSPTDFVFYFQSLKKEDLIKIANESSLSNKWLNFELIRQIIEKEHKETIDESEIGAVKNILDRIKLNDFNFLKQTTIYFHRSRLFNASLGVFLVSVNNPEMEEIISGFSIDKYAFHSKTRDELLNHYAKPVSEEQLDLFLELIFNKWKRYFDNILTTEDFYQNSILLTDFANFVVHYHTRKTADNDLVSSMENLIQKIKFIDSEWSTSSSQQLTKFHLYHSELYLLTYAYKYKKLNNPQILTNYESIINDKVQRSRYVSDETQQLFEIGRKNIDRTKDE